MPWWATVYLSFLIALAIGLVPTLFSIKYPLWRMVCDCMATIFLFFAFRSYWQLELLPAGVVAPIIFFTVNLWGALTFQYQWKFFKENLDVDSDYSSMNAIEKVIYQELEKWLDPVSLFLAIVGLAPLYVYGGLACVFAAFPLLETAKR